MIFATYHLYSSIIFDHILTVQYATSIHFHTNQVCTTPLALSSIQAAIISILSPGCTSGVSIDAWGARLSGMTHQPQDTGRFWEYGRPLDRKIQFSNFSFEPLNPSFSPFSNPLSHLQPIRQPTFHVSPEANQAGRSRCLSSSFKLDGSHPPLFVF